MKFVADGMLGKLTRWLRILGYDVKYSISLGDDQLIAIAKREKRALLTRDFELYKQAVAKGVDALYLEGSTGEEKLAELAERYKISLDVDMSKSRCPKCNAKVKPISKEKVKRKVEKETFARHDEFWVCPKCGQIYWRGAHWTGIRQKLVRTNEILQTIHKNKKWTARVQPD